MKNYTKWICVGAGVLIAAGLIIGILGWLFNGRFNLNIYSVGSSYTITDSDIKVDVRQIKEFDKLEIEASLTDVIINSGDKYELEISAPEKLMPEVKEENGKLIIKQPKSVNINIRSGEIYYKLTVPAGSDIDANIGVTSGDISIDNINVQGEISQTSGNLNIKGDVSDKLSLGSTSGDLWMSDCELKDISIDKTSGNVDLDNVRTDKLSVNTTSGEISLTKATMNELTVEATSGDVTGIDCDIKNITIHGTSTEVNIELKGDVSDYDYSIETLSGDICIDTMEMAEHYKTKSGASQNIKVDTTSGDVKFSF